MKQVLAILLGLILTLAVLFLAFDSPFFHSDPTTVPTTAPTTVPTTKPTTLPTNPTGTPGTDPVVLDLPMSAVMLTQQIESSRNDDGTVYFTYTYPNVRLFLSGESVSEKVTLDLLNRIDATRIKADALRNDASHVGGVSYFYHVQYIPQRIDSAVLSLSGTTTSFSGGAHPGSTCTGITYDLLSGNVLTLDDILTEKCTADVLCRLVVDALTEVNKDGLLYNDFSVSVEDRFSGNFRADESWYLSGEGLCFDFEPYEVGPYSSSVVTAVIPYHQLPGYLEDAWFPMEQIQSSGSLIIEALTENSLDPYSSLAEVNLDPTADALVIHTDGLLYNITIETTGPNSMVIFAADHLTPGNSVVLRSGSTLQISYTADGDAHTQPCKTP